MMLLIVGLALFFAVHLLPTAPEVRDGFRARLGEGPYKIAFSVVSLIGFAVIVLGYHKMQLHPGKNPVLYDPPEMMRHITMALMLPAMILLVAAYVPSKIRTMVKHPMLWALAHLLSNGDVASLLLFGSFLAYGIYDRISVKKRGAQGPLGAKQASSIVNDVIVVAVGTALYFALVQQDRLNFQ